MKKHHLQIFIVVYILGIFGLAYLSVQELLSPTFRYVSPSSPIVFGIGWIIFGGYYLAYDKVSDLTEKWIEGILSGLCISTFLYIADLYYVIREYHQESDFWGNYYSTTVIKQLWLPDGVIYQIIIFIIAWFAIDIWKSKFDNAIIKFILLIISIISFLVIPTGNQSKIIITTAISTALAVGYYYLRQVDNTQRRISALLYITLSFGVFATILKHWGFISRNLLLQNYTVAGLAEVFSDFVVFLLGFLLILFESSKVESSQNQNNQQIRKIVQEIDVEKHEVDNKSFLTIHSTLLLVFLIGITVWIRSINLKSELRERRKQHSVSKAG